MTTTSHHLLNVKTRLSEFKSNVDKDATSETSTGTTNSLTSSEELQKLAVILGLKSAEDVYQERFRVDRRRLEGMLAENLEESQTAQAFFHKLMNETNTLINWPVRLKIGARSKKDPHVRVAGRPDDVKNARERIMQLLDTRSNRVTMKIDVSYTDHSHIIGKGGLTIKRVMEETGCHIHFPDSNRNPGLDKSNQVSIAGDMEKVERARARVRALTPLVFSFELPILASPQQMPDLNSPYVKQIQEKYNVQVTLRTRQKLHATLILVKGVQWEVEAAMEATTELLKYMCGNFVNQTKVQMSLEISPMHHAVVIGHGAEQLKMIMRGTKTLIMVPDAEDPNIPNIKKSCVLITGNIEDVYAARQQLIGSLPLVIMFEVSEQQWQPMPELLSSIQQKHGVHITARRRHKQGLCSVQIKGLERYAGNIYDARRAILGAREPAVNPEIPESYNIPNLPSNSMPDFGVYNPFSPPHGTSPLPSFISLFDYGSPLYASHNPPTPGGYPTPVSPLELTPPIFHKTWVIPSPQPRNGQFIYPNNVINPNSVVYNQDTNGNWTAAGPIGHLAPIIMQPPTTATTSQYPHPQTQERAQSALSVMNCSSRTSSGYQSNFTGSLISLDTHSTSGGESNIVSPSVSPVSKTTQSPTSSNDVERSQNELAHIISDMPLSERRAVGCEKKTLETIQARNSPITDYNKMKLEAERAMQEPVAGTSRVPTSRWAGSFFSRTSPSAFVLPDPPAPTRDNTPEKNWNSPGRRSTDGVAESPTTSSPEKLCKLYEIMCQKGLNKYTELFKQHELDLGTFTTLNEADLIEIGVSAFGARRKMLLLIEDLKQQKIMFQGSVAPGAERKASPYKSPTNW